MESTTPGADPPKQARFAESTDVLVTADIRLGDDPHPVPFVGEHATDDRDSVGGRVDISVSRHRGSRPAHPNRARFRFGLDLFPLSMVELKLYYIHKQAETEQPGDADDRLEVVLHAYL